MQQSIISKTQNLNPAPPKIPQTCRPNPSVKEKTLHQRSNDD